MTGGSDPTPGEATAKIVMPPLDARAPRPSVVRLRKGMVAAGALTVGALLAGALVWAFVVQPELRAKARTTAVDAPETTSRSLVRPSERVTVQPATYAQLDRLPEPRALGDTRKSPDAATVPSNAQIGGSTAASRPGVTTDPAAPARASELFFAASRTASPPPVRPAAATTAGPGSAGDSVRAPRPLRASDATGDYATAYNGHGLLAPLSPYELKAGAMLPAALLTAVDTSRAGPALAVVTDNVFDSVTGRHLLVPQGSRLIGRHEGESRQGDKRAFLAWERLILPNGKSVLLADAQGIDAQGAVGVAGRVDRHLKPLALATLFAGAITTLGQAARDRDDDSGGWLGNAGSAASIEAAQVGGRLVDRELSVRPVVRLPPGGRVRVLLTRDLILEPYDR